MHCVTVLTPVGEFHLIIDEADAVRASGFGRLADLQKRLPEELQGQKVVEVVSHPYKEAVEAYFAGDLQALDAINYEQDGSDFYVRAWAEMAKVPAGRVVSYKELAEACGSPAAVRAVGTVCGKNRLILLVPCHRVVKTGGGLGNYLYGTTIKEFLLKHEGALS